MAAKKRSSKREAEYLAYENATDLWAHLGSETRFTGQLANEPYAGEAYPPRLLYLMAATVYRSVQKLLGKQSWLSLLDAIEAYADGQITGQQLKSVFDERELYSPKLPAAVALVADSTDWLLDEREVIEGVDYVTDAMGTLGAMEAGILKKDASGWEGRQVLNEPSFLAAKQAHERLLCGLIRDIFGNPYRPVAFDPAWRAEAATGLALKMYEEKDFRAMPILADALEEAGCDGEAILSHCREPGTHVCGCWVVDAVLGKE